MSVYPSCEIRDVFECPVCGRQAVVLATELLKPPERPFICDFGHRTVEMEQRLPDAYRAEFQSVNWERDLDAPELDRPSVDEWPFEDDPPDPL